MSRNKKFQINNLFKFFILIFFLANTLLLAQEQKTEFKITSNPNNINSWWLEKNNFGIHPTNFDFKSTWKLYKSNTTYSFDILIQENNSYLSESFIKYNLSNHTFLRLGRYYRDFSNYLNDNLSSGHMLISKNAKPMPKIGLVTKKKIKKFDKMIFDFGISHANFNKNNIYNKAPYLHEKFIYMNIKSDNYKISIGLVHEAIWAGSISDGEEQPNSFKDFLKVFIAEDGPFKEGQLHANALGNHLGIWDFYYQKNKNNKILKLYYQHFFEDTSGLRFRNEIDGLWGLELQNYISNTTLLFEYLHTTHQNMDPPYINDSYYNHAIYLEGWSYSNYTLGNPFINHLNVEPVNIIHVGIDGELPAGYYYNAQFSNKTTINDYIKYKLIFGKKIYKSNTEIILINDSKDRINIGFSLSWFL